MPAQSHGDTNVIIRLPDVPGAEIERRFIRSVARVLARRALEDVLHAMTPPINS